MTHHVLGEVIKPKFLFAMRASRLGDFGRHMGFSDSPGENKSDLSILWRGGRIVGTQRPGGRFFSLGRIWPPAFQTIIPIPVYAPINLKHSINFINHNTFPYNHVFLLNPEKREV